MGIGGGSFDEASGVGMVEGVDLGGFSFTILLLVYQNANLDASLFCST